LRANTSSSTNGLSASAIAATMPSWISIASASRPINPSPDCQRMLTRAPSAPPNIDVEMIRPDISGAYAPASRPGRRSSVM
jgi:hypothetical protein